ncbi:MAG: type IV pilus twitching motility protein PilT [Candidatus Omnitrophica bacterium]|nr:type IV pilus twitching motility protein PilT [Candidatus Omnitrophota bacterium]
MDIKELLKAAVAKNASDLHLTVGRPPTFRINRKLVSSSYPVLNGTDTKQMIYSLLNDEQKKRFERELEFDFSIAVEGVSRFRVNIHMQRGSIEAAFRTIAQHIKTFDEMRFPKVMRDLTLKQNGLVLVTGPTGVGKTTTLAAMIDLINKEKEKLIVCIEDPIEYLHKHNKSIVKQREIGIDTHSFANALKYSLRQDPDVILVGEMRDIETISIALTAAETGHLVLSTLHTASAPQTVDRLLDVFPPEQQEQVKVQLSSCIQGIISQTLLPRYDGRGLVAAFEIMIATPSVRKLIKERKTEQLMTCIQTGGEFGMISMDAAIKDLYHDGLIDLATTRLHVKDASDIKGMDGMEGVV